MSPIQGKSVCNAIVLFYKINFKERELKKYLKIL